MDIEKCECGHYNILVYLVYMLPLPLLLRRTIITHWILISSFWRAIFMLFCCLSCDRSFLRPLASLRTDRLLLDTAAAAVESLRWCYSMTVVCKVDRSSWLFLTICMALQSGNHYLVMDRDLTQDKSSRLLIQGLAKYTKNIQGRYCKWIP